MALFTVGHSTRDIDEFVALLQAHDIDRLVDVRRFPGSRRYPQFGSESLARTLAAHDIAYEHAEALGGRRPTSAASPNGAWRNASFRGYADYMMTREFHDALARVLDLAKDENVVVMCAEAVPWRCHRNLIADAAVARGVAVRHILSAERTDEHSLSGHARLRSDGQLVYPPSGDAQPDLF